MVDLVALRTLTKDLATEIHNEYEGPLWNLVTHIFNNIDSWVAIISDDGKLLFANDSVIKHCLDYGYDLHQCIGQYCKDIDIPICDKKCNTCSIRKSIDTRKAITTSYRCQVSDMKFKLVCIPLVYNGISGVITILSESG